MSFREYFDERLEEEIKEMKDSLISFETELTDRNICFRKQKVTLHRELVEVPIDSEWRVKGVTGDNLFLCKGNQLKVLDRSLQVVRQQTYRSNINKIIDGRVFVEAKESLKCYNDGSFSLADKDTYCGMYFINDKPLLTPTYRSVQCSSIHHYAYIELKTLVVVDTRTGESTNYLLPPKHRISKVFFIGDEVCYVAKMKQDRVLTMFWQVLLPTAGPGGKTIYHAKSLTDISENYIDVAKFGNDSMVDLGYRSNEWSRLSLTIE